MEEAIAKSVIESQGYRVLSINYIPEGRSHHGFDIVLELSDRSVTVDVKTILDEDYRISLSTKNPQKMADFFVLIFVDLCGGHFRVRGFS